MPIIDDSVIEISNKLWSNSIVDSKTGCRLWQGARNELGYGRIAIRESDGKLHNRYVHIISYKLFIGQPNPLVLHKDWLCLNKNCWNPEHLYSGNYSENQHDSLNKHGHPLRNRTHCLNGHEYTEQTTRKLKNGHRMCLTCFNIRNNKLKEKLKLKKTRG